MCGRYAMALRPSQIRQMLQDDDMSVDDAPADEGDGAPRQSYNFAPSYHGVVYRANSPGRGAGTSHRARSGNDDASVAAEPPAADTTATTDITTTDTTAADTTAANSPPPTVTTSHPGPTPSTPTPSTSPSTHYKLQSMKWGLIPSWSKHTPDYATTLKTINCRADSLASPGGLWASMKTRKRCVVPVQGFFEWRTVGNHKTPYYVKRKDGRLMLFAGLWDCVHPDDEQGGQGEGLYSYTVVTTESNKQLGFLHDRMPVILEAGSEGLWRWLDPGRTEWGGELQGLLKPFKGELEVYAVSGEVGKVGNNSPQFVVPVASRENKANIANFFAKGGKKGEVGEVGEGAGVGKGAGDEGVLGTLKKGVKREADPSPGKEEPPAKKPASFTATTPTKKVASFTVTSPVKKTAPGKISATKNTARSPAKAKAKPDGSQKITKFFGSA
ncbi:hypothetical protein C8A05DRAFT_15686 [Staphylotrichum tortipilum]|uniref:DUF159-domain-containing protein n=1 Tax=Staphylotrichum tortipilum TaxID=2831512 RepID=A0AAN6RU63_9PEZI|nr:hypothetical protein C8A05DRAFT_15686 [Staphylotrichum longicolle]